ncbi:uncharacterized protein LOC111053922 isoform X5 [Nilaparvata lugens]|uniref:uncharacterized protein LOC111053922 isoform X5 n=1 Tax=Nilaparvata lugens TaxID=108931 RepID=UPI000B99487E|nr:uncharacterized protein LOC111053922 isoform X5 [Nilaparvata lugens]
MTNGLLQFQMHFRGINCFLLLALLVALPCRADGRSVNYEYEDDDDDWAWTWGRDLETGTNDLDRHGRQLSKRAGGVSERQRRVEEAEDAGWLGLGVLSDMQQFFDNLKTNLDALETIPPDDKDSLLLGKQVTVTAPQASAVEKERHFRPSATAAYLHALRNHRPSYKIRNFVESPEPVSLRGTNRYDPSLLWTGLGRRRR